MYLLIIDADLLPYFCLLLVLSSWRSLFSSEREVGFPDEVKWFVKAGLVFQQLSGELVDEKWLLEAGWEGRGVSVMRRPLLAEEPFAFNLQIWKVIIKSE